MRYGMVTVNGVAASAASVGEPESVLNLKSAFPISVNAPSATKLYHSTRAKIFV